MPAFACVVGCQRSVIGVAECVNSIALGHVSVIGTDVQTSPCVRARGGAEQSVSDEYLGLA
eukprot:9774064-Lingulodinium_polyedra.AAC.1